MKIPMKSPDPALSPEQYVKNLAEEDVDNLVDNYEMALFVEKKIVMKPEYYKFTDLSDVERSGYCFRVADNVSNNLSRDLPRYFACLEEQKQKGMPVDPDVWAQAEEIKKAGTDSVAGKTLEKELQEYRSQMSTLLLQAKMKVSNLLPTVMEQDIVIESCRLALKTVRQMPDGDYKTLMEQKLEKRLKDASNLRAEIMRNIVTPEVRSEGQSAEYIQEVQQRTDELSRAMERMSAVYRNSGGQVGRDADPSPYLEIIFDLGSARMKYAKLIKAASEWRSAESRQFEAQEDQRLKAKRDAFDAGVPRT